MWLEILGNNIIENVPICISDGYYFLIWHMLCEDVTGTLIVDDKYIVVSFGTLDGKRLVSLENVCLCIVAMMEQYMELILLSCTVLYLEIYFSSGRKGEFTGSLVFFKYWLTLVWCMCPLMVGADCLRGRLN